MIVRPVGVDHRNLDPRSLQVLDAGGGIERSHELLVPGLDVYVDEIPPDFPRKPFLRHG